MRPIRASLIAGIVSGAPSTIHALAKGSDPLEAIEAAGSLILPQSQDRTRLIVAAIPAHLAISLFWGTVLSHALPRRNRLLWGAAAGAGIAALDLGLVGRRWPRIRSLAVLPQVADHIAFGATVAHLSW